MLLLAAVLVAVIVPRATLAAPLDPSAELLAAFEQLRNGQYTRAIESARSLVVEHPPDNSNDPLPLLLEAQARFDLIFCQTGHITGEQVWHLSSPDQSPHDQPFERVLAQAVALSERMKRATPAAPPAANAKAAALGHFYAGTAHGFRARLSTLREQTLPSGRAGKRMREELQAAAALDPTLALEADVGLGLYDYYADSLSPLIKMFRFFLFIPGGQVERGIAKLRGAAEAPSLAATNGRNHQQAAEGGPAAILLQPEARWELARIVGVREGRHDEAVKLLATLVESYPDNALFALLAALEAEGMGNLELANHYAAKAVEAVPRMDATCRPKLDPATRQAAARIAEALRAQTP